MVERILNLTREEILVELFNKIDQFLDIPVPEGAFTIEQYREAKGLTYERARRAIYQAYKTGLLDRRQIRRNMYYFEKNIEEV